MHDIPRSHPRAESLRTRNTLVCGFDDGLVAREGLIAHGRGEAFDYIAGERTGRAAQKSIGAAAAMLLLAEHPIISVNGNVAALCPRDAVRLARAAHAQLEVNLFYDSMSRRRKIAARLVSHGAPSVYGARRSDHTRLPGLESSRGIIDCNGIGRADVVLVALEDGDRAEALQRSGVRVIAIDLNPLSRTAQRADITIVDNVTRALPLLVSRCTEQRRTPRSTLRRTLTRYDNGANLGAHIEGIGRYLGRMTRHKVSV